MSFRLIVLALSLAGLGVGPLCGSGLRGIDFEETPVELDDEPLQSAKMIPAENQARLATQAPRLRLTREKTGEEDINLVTINQYQYRSSRRAEEGVPVQRAGKKRWRASKR